MESNLTFFSDFCYLYEDDKGKIFIGITSTPGSLLVPNSLSQNGIKRICLKLGTFRYERLLYIPAPRADKTASSPDSRLRKFWITTKGFIYRLVLWFSSRPKLVLSLIKGGELLLAWLLSQM